jgi:hypothetical protein
MSVDTASGAESSGRKPKTGAIFSIAFGLVACFCMFWMWAIDKTAFPVRQQEIGSLFEAIILSPLAIGFVGCSAAAILVGIGTLVIRPSLLAIAGIALGAASWFGWYYAPAGQAFSKATQIEARQNAQVLQTRKELTEMLRIINSNAPVSLVLSNPDYRNTCLAKPKEANEVKPTLWAECSILESRGEILIDPAAPSALTLQVTLEDDVHTVGKSQATTDVPRAPKSRLSMIFRGDLVADKSAVAIHGQSISGNVDQSFGTGIKNRSVQVNDATFAWIGSHDGPDRIADADFIFDLEPTEQRPAIQYRTRLKVAFR